MTTILMPTIREVAPPILKYIDRRDGMFYMYFERINLIKDDRLTWEILHYSESWKFYCWTTSDEAVAIEYVLRYG